MATASLMPFLKFNLPPPNSKISPPQNHPRPLKPEFLNHGLEELKSNKTLAATYPIRIQPPPTTLKTHAHKLRELIQSQMLDEAMDLYINLKSEGMGPGIVLESMLIDSFMKSSRVSDAFRVFDGMTERNVVAWTSMISGSGRNGRQRIGVSLFLEMLKSGVIPNDFAINATLGACADLTALGLGEQLHSLMERSGLAGDCRTANCLIDFYSRCGKTDRAELVFELMPERDVVSFTSLVSGFCRNNLFEQAIRVFDQMVREGIEANEHTVTSILTACGPMLGEQIHGYMIKSMISRSIYAASALIEFYSEYSELESANLVFERLGAKNVVTWSSMISCCLRNDQVENALRMFYAMICSGIEPNEFTFSTAIGACGLYSESIFLGLQLHCSIIKLNLASDNRVLNALLTMYARNHRTEELGKVFDRIRNPDVVSWCAAISGFFQNGFNEKSTRLLCEMHRLGFIPNDYGFSSALGSCANLALLDQGRQFHCLALKSACDLDVCTGNALVSMYAKCGCMDDARLAFEVMPSHDAMSWNSLIHAYAHHGHAKKALEVFEEMLELKDCSPDHSTFVGILVGCSYVGCIDEAIRYFRIMSHYGIVPSASHYACMIDMMGRAGRFDEALHIIDGMPFEPDILIWKTLLGSCRLHRNLELGKVAAEMVIGLTPKDSASYVLLSNLHAMHGKWDDAERVRTMMDEMGVKKDSGWSWIESRNEVHAFAAGDKSHPKAEIIYGMLGGLFMVMKDQGYSPDISLQLYSF